MTSSHDPTPSPTAGTVGAGRGLDPLVAQLVEARLKAGLTQVAIEQASGIHQSSISEYETGVSTPSLSSLRRYAQVLGLQPALVPLTYRPGFEYPTTAPAAWTLSAGNGTAEPARIASPAVPASAAGAAADQSGGRADVARTLDVAEATAALARERR